VARGLKAKVVLWDGRSFEGHVVERDNGRDLAALRIETVGLPAVAPRDSSEARPGELVIAVGNPFGFVGALSTGVVHAIGSLPSGSRRKWIQADVRLAPGNSGGPLADARGQVIGINTMVTNRGLALAVPSNSVEAFLKHGSPVALGVVVHPVRAGLSLGLLILEVEEGSPAEAASLAVGDVLVGAGRRTFASPADLSDAIEANQGAVLRLQFLRGNRDVRRETTVQLGAASVRAA
jgi:serine protease Do